MIDFAILAEANKFARELADKEIKNLANLYEWNDEQIKIAKDIAEHLLSSGYYSGARKYKNVENKNEN